MISAGAHVALQEWLAWTRTARCCLRQATQGVHDLQRRRRGRRQRPRMPDSRRTRRVMKRGPCQGGKDVAAMHACPAAALGALILRRCALPALPSPLL